MDQPQQKMKAGLESLGIPYKEINVYGRQIMVTAWSRSAAQRWVGALSRFGGKLRCGEGVDYAKENKNTVLRPSTIKVWRVWVNLAA